MSTSQSNMKAWPSFSGTQWARIYRRLRPELPQRAIIVRVSGLVARVKLGSCAWCTDRAICSACGSKADRARVSLARTAAKRASRKAAA